MENPWGEPSPPLASAPSSSTDRRDSSESQAAEVDDTQQAAPRLSLELVDEDDDAPAWDAQDSPDDDADDAWANEARASMLKVNDLTLAEQEEAEGEEARDAAGLATSLDTGDEEETQGAEPPAPAPPIPVVPPALPDFDVDAGQQMDEFPEDDEVHGGGGDQDETKDGGGDEFDDFGDTAGGGDDDEFGDFGDFGDAAPLDEAAFEAAPPSTTTTPLPSTSLSSAASYSTHQPFASTSTATVSYPPLHFDLSGDPSRQSISSQLHDFWQGAFPAAANAVSDEPERQVEGVAQMLVSESSYVLLSLSLLLNKPQVLLGTENHPCTRRRSLWSELSTLPPLRPVDWRRSRIRREHLISMGFPVSQEEVRRVADFPRFLFSYFSRSL